MSFPREVGLRCTRREAAGSHPRLLRNNETGARRRSQRPAKSLGHVNITLHWGTIFVAKRIRHDRLCGLRTSFLHMHARPLACIPQKESRIEGEQKKNCTKRLFLAVRKLATNVAPVLIKTTKKQNDGETKYNTR